MQRPKKTKGKPAPHTPAAPPIDEPQGPFWRREAGILALTALAALLILPNLGGTSLWADEGDTAVMAMSVLVNGIPKAWDGVTFTDSDAGKRLNDALVQVTHPWVPFYVAAPMTTVDLACPDGSAIPIEERHGSEVLSLAGQAIAPAGVTARYVAFDVTPARYVTAIVTDRGGCRAPYGESLRRAAGAR